MNAHLRRCVWISLSAIVICGESALAQSQQQDEERMRREGVERADAAARAQGMEMERQRQERERQAEEGRRSQSNSSTGGGYTPSPSGGGSAGTAAGGTDLRSLREGLMRLPTVPVERNVLLGSWRLQGGGQRSGDAEFLVTGKGNGGDGGLGDIVGMLARMNPEKMLCDVSFGGGITFAPTTFRSSGVAGMAGGPVAYRSRRKEVIVAIPGDSRANPMSFEIVGPDRIVSKIGGCALVRIGTTAANAAANATTAPGNAPTAAARSSVPPAAGAMPQVAAVTPTPPPASPAGRPPPEVCRNRLLDKLGTVGVNHVRAMSDVRFKEAAIEGKVPNTNNLRLDLRGSACDDPRIKATLYDFDANQMLQSITYVWDRPAGPAPAPIFSERVTHLTRVLSLPPPQSPGRLQADISFGRLILQDMPERNLLLEAYKAAK